MWNAQDITEINSIIHTIDNDLNGEIENSSGWTSPFSAKLATATVSRDEMFVSTRELAFAEMELKSLLRSNRQSYLANHQRHLAVKRSTSLATKRVVIEQSWRREYGELFTRETCAKLVLQSQDLHSNNRGTSDIDEILEELRKQKSSTATNLLSNECARYGSKIPSECRQFAEWLVEMCFETSGVDAVLSNLETVRKALHNKTIESPP